MFTIRKFAMVLGCAALLLAPRSAAAFDTQPHFDMTWDAMAAEGFGYVPIRVVQCANWFNDFYENPTKNPYSGHAPIYLRLLKSPLGRGEDWPEAVRKASARAHFDDDTPVQDTASIDAEWTRLSRATRAALQKCAAAGDLEGMLSVMGISLHMVQDFYTHSNWVEPRGMAGFDGPGWAAMNTYGAHPTWFDISPAERAKVKIYADGGLGGRDHGHWKSDGGRNLATALNKDCSGRPLHLNAYLTAYVASRQWLRAMESWLGNPSVWQQLKNFTNKRGADMDRDYEAAFSISFYSGHWNGNGEPAFGPQPGPGGSLDDLKGSMDAYFAGRKTYFRGKWEQMILQMDDRNPPAAATPVASSQSLRDGLDAVVVQITDIEAVDSRDPLPGDEADWYMRAKIDGQDYISSFIHGKDHMDFTQKPYGPFTFIRVRPRSSGPVAITLSLFDDDSGPYGDDDECDISPVAGRKPLELKYDRAGPAITGDIQARSIATVRGKGDKETAEITLSIRTIRL